MATRRTTFDKLQRERAKKAKAAAKRERRQERGENDEERDVDLDLGSEEECTPGELLQRIEAVHERYANEQISFEEFEEQKTELLTRLSLLPIE